jgi:NADH-quinone oxidoreductase subunit M
MVNHGIVTAALFFIIAVLAVRAGGSERLSHMGGLALRAPVLAALFLIVALATLAMPGSGNFVGELYILFGIFQSKLAFGLVASSGVALAAVYMIRMYQRSMHNRQAPGTESRELSRWDFGLIAPLVAVIIFLGVYPQFVLGRSEKSTVSQVANAAPKAYARVAGPGWTCYTPVTAECIASQTGQSP